jgi:hypothetical protein
VKAEHQLAWWLSIRSALNGDGGIREIQLSACMVYEIHNPLLYMGEIQNSRSGFVLV